MSRSTTEETPLHLAQVNIARMTAPLDDPVMASFVAAIDEVNAIADTSPGFVWRPPSDDPLDESPFGDEWLLINVSVWESIDALEAFVYRTMHADVLRRRHEWFHRIDQAYTAMWWIPPGHRPTGAEAKQRLDHLREHGATPHAFTFRARFEPEG